jgi:hypothetical protein
MTDQDRDMGIGRRRGRGRQQYLSSADSLSSHNIGCSESYAHGFDTYMTFDLSQLVQDVQYAYEWENLDFYNMLVQQ